MNYMFISSILSCKREKENGKKSYVHQRLERHKLSTAFLAEKQKIVQVIYLVFFHMLLLSLVPVRTQLRLEVSHRFHDFPREK